MIKKYPLYSAGSGTVMFPYMARALSVAFQRDTLVMWVDDPVYPDEEGHLVEVMVVVTGDDAPNRNAGWRFLGTAMTASGAFVVHVWVRGDWS